MLKAAAKDQNASINCRRITTTPELERGFRNFDAAMRHQQPICNLVFGDIKGSSNLVVEKVLVEYKDT